MAEWSWGNCVIKTRDFVKSSIVADLDYDEPESEIDRTEFRVGLRLILVGCFVSLASIAAALWVYA